MSWPQIKKTVTLKHHFLLFYAITMNHFLTGLWCATKSGFYMTTNDDQFSDWTEKRQGTSQSQTCPQKRSWSLFGGLLPVWSTIAFWTLVKSLHLSMLSKSLRYTKNFNACSWHWSTEGPNSPRQHPTTHHTTNASQVEWIRLWSFASSTIFLTSHLTSHQPTTNFFKYLDNFCKENASTTRRMQNFQEFNEFGSADFYTTGIEVFLVGKNVLIVMVPILINKDIFEPSYNDLKYMVQNHNQFCTNSTYSD